ncbi:YtpI family protein [Paenibacillus pini]|uniref:YtpI-like protein n=1 Tax=Paenibacillus pini JCM 16418 TaxID=1236976 RepID=W7Y637_9BACL|nr:YtpI family protein [Paenibacillus pini]GAF06315.1 hypothetical protein JCM16418_266 [Paenibacillus pini JCM 16418]
MVVIKYLLFALLVITCLSSAFYSYRSRRTSDPLEKGINGAQMNIFMGIMLIVLSLIFMFIFRGSTVAIIIEALFLVLGAFNVFAGLRNRSYFSRMKSSQT